MNELPDFFRTETWHPLSVHFPIVLLLFATIFHVLGLKIMKKSLPQAANIMLLAGTAAAWISVYTGNMADGIVSREICDPTVLKDHENASITAAWLFTAASALVIADLTGLLKKFRNWLKAAAIIIMLTGSGFLIYTGHLGATLVYQQAAGVYVPSEDCHEFE